MNKWYENASWIMGERILRMITGFTIGILSARIFAPELFGVLSWAMSLVALSMPLMTQGLESIVPRDIIRDPSNEPNLLGAALLMKTTGAVIALIVVIVMAYLVKPGDWYAFWTLVILLIGQVFQVLDVFEYGFIARDDRKTPAIVRSAVLLTTATGKILILLLRPDLRLFASVVAVEIAATYLILLVLERRCNSTLIIFANWKAGVIAAWREGAWAFASALATMFFMRIDQIVVEYILGSAKLGVYAAAVRLAEVSYFVPVAFAASLYPTLIRLKEQGDPDFHRTYALLGRQNIAVAIAISTVTAIGGLWVVPILFGKAYADASGILAIYAWGLVPIAANQCVGKWLLIHGKIKWLAALQFAGAITNIGLNLLLVPIFGLKGAAWVTVASYTFSSIVFPLILSATRESVTGLIGIRSKSHEIE